MVPFKKIFLFTIIVCITVLVYSSAYAQTYVSGPITSNTTWTKANNPYIVTGDIPIASGITLTINPGVEVKFNGNYSITATSTATLDAQGTAQDMITFTSNKAAPAKGDWVSVVLGSTSIVKYAKIEYSHYGITTFGNSQIESCLIQNNLTGISSSYTNSPVILNNTITDNDIGIDIYILAGFTGQINQNSIHTNANYNLKASGTPATHMIDAQNNWWGTTDIPTLQSRIDGVQYVDFVPFLDGPNGNPIPGNFVHGDILTNETWTKANSPYIVVGDISINPRVTLTINAGVKILFAGYFTLANSGTLHAVGTQTENILFSTYNQTSPQPDDWFGIHTVNSTATIQFARLEYANTSLIMEGSQTAANIQNCFLKNNLTGIKADTIAHASIQNNIFTKNNYGIYIQPFLASQPTLQINNNQIDNSRYYHLYVNGDWRDYSGLTIDAAQNWWGSNVLAEIDTKIYDNNDNPLLPVVNITPFLNSPGTNHIAITNTSVTRQFINTILGETTTIDYDLSLPGSVTIQIFDYYTNTAVRTLINSVSKPAGNNQEVWDGKDGTGQFLPNGTYYYKINIIDAQNRQGEYDPIYVPGTVQFLNGSINPRSINPWKGEQATIAYNLFAPAWITIRTGESAARQALRTLTDQEPQDTQGNIVRWDGRKDDRQLAYPLAGDTLFYGWTGILPDNSIVIKNIGAQVQSIKADPYAIYTIFGETTKIEYTISAAANVTVKIKDPQGNLIKTILTRQQQTAGTHQITWNGVNRYSETVAEGGDYIIEVTAEDLTGRATHTKIGNITILEDD